MTYNNGTKLEDSSLSRFRHTRACNPWPHVANRLSPAGYYHCGVILIMTSRA